MTVNRPAGYDKAPSHLRGGLNTSEVTELRRCGHRPKVPCCSGRRVRLVATYKPAVRESIIFAVVQPCSEGLLGLRGPLQVDCPVSVSRLEGQRRRRVLVGVREPFVHCDHARCRADGRQ